MIDGRDIDEGSREHYADGLLYDYEYRRRRADVNFYRALAREELGAATDAKPGDRILELGAGSGRVSLPLARDGHTVVALDSSEPMLAQLRSRTTRTLAPRITTVAADLRSFAPIGRRFPLAIAAFNVLEHLYTRSELAASLACVRAALTDDGIFAFDVQNPDLAWLVRDPDKRWAKTRFTDPATGRPTYYSTNHVYDPISQIVVIRLYYEPVDGKGPTRVVRLSQRKFFPAELEALVAHAGFRVLARYGDFFSTPLVGASESQVLICQPAPKPRRKPAKP
ncbi:MAG: methyltransferase domain-containing protein [Proteobacteria bacterium]|nr:methyltransferase domain-containing protein [Pseudomonadota bacterium]